jgi:MoaA/NifB/PqqE/SkfB family radical SAM enzyme
LKCRICGIWKEQWEIPEKTVGEIISLLPYLERVVWQGGEVFLSQYFERLFENASLYQNLKQTIVTNGLLIDEKWAEKLARSNVCLTYSVDAVDKEGYEHITGGGAKFEDLLRGIDLVNKYRHEHNCYKDFFNKMTTILNVVVMESNYRQIEGIIDFAKKFQFDEIQLVPILGIMGPENIFVNQDQEAGEYLSGIMPKVFEKVRDYNIVLHNWLPPIAFPVNDPTKGKEQKTDCAASNSHIKKNKEVICYLPWQQMFMTPDHKLKPGCYCVQELGDIDNNSLGEIWNGPVMQLYRRKLLDSDYKDLCDSACVTGVIPTKELKVSRYW